MFERPHPAATGQLPIEVINRAIREAQESSCRKSRRGCAVFIQRKTGEIVIAGQGHNDPPGAEHCDGSAACRATCRKRCVHAEVDAVIDMLNLRIIGKPHDSVPELVHVKLDDAGKLVAGGPPSFWACSNVIIHAGIHAVWLNEDLWEGPRWTRWTATTFLRSTLKRQPDHPDFQPRAGIECPCESISCRAQDGAKRDQKGAWRCIKCGHPSP